MSNKMDSFNNLFVLFFPKTPLHFKSRSNRNLVSMYNAMYNISRCLLMEYFSCDSVTQKKLSVRSKQLNLQGNCGL